MERGGMETRGMHFPQLSVGDNHPAHSPVDDQGGVQGRLITHRTHPGGLPLVHLDVERCVEALPGQTKRGIQV